MALDAEINAMMQDDIAAATSDLSAVLTYKRNFTTGTMSPVGSGDNIDPDGIIQTADAEFVGLASAFAEVPGARDVVDVDGVKYYVESMTTDDAAVTLRLKRGA